MENKYYLLPSNHIFCTSKNNKEEKKQSGMVFEPQMQPFAVQVNNLECKPYVTPNLFKTAQTAKYPMTLS